MAYNHGVRISEVATSLLPTAEVSAGIPFIVGTAPVNMTDPSNVNVPKLVYSYAEAVKEFGYVPPADDAASGLKKFGFSISEFIYSQFSLFGVGPAIIVNVLDPTKHKVTASITQVALDTKTGSATIPETAIIASTVVLSGTSGDYARGTDYTLSFDDDGQLVVTSLKNSEGDFLCATGTDLTFAAEKLDPSKVSADDIIGGVTAAGVKSGLELVSECFPRFRLVPGLIIAPGFSENPGVAAVMAAKSSGINSVFNAVCIVDIPTDEVKTYTEAAAWKNTNNVTDPTQIACWPKLALDGIVFNQSTQLAGLIGQVDSENDDVPYVSPSNKNYQMTSAVLDDGEEVWLDVETAAYLNGQGIVTALNFTGGWKCWGNRTACYPANTDVKDAFIPIRRMFAWVGNTFVQTFWQRVDYPLTRRQVDVIVDSANIWMNGLAAKQYILGGTVEFRESDNPTTDLMDGISVFHVRITPPSPNREISFVLEYDPSYLQTLFG